MKKTVLAISSLLLVTSVAFAGYGDRGHCDMKKGGDDKRSGKYCNSKRGGKGGYHKDKAHFAGMPIMRFVTKLDLSDKQIDKVYDLLEEHKESQKKQRMFDKRANEFKKAFTKTSFNKEELIKSMNKRKMEQINLMEKIYNILDNKQKENLYNLLNK